MQFAIVVVLISLAIGVVACSDEEALQRPRRSNLMAQILYDGLRQRLDNSEMHQPHARRRVASSSFVRRRRSTTPLLLQSLARSAAKTQLVDELQKEVRDMSDRVRKRSLMAMILKDQLRERLEQEKRHDNFGLWGRSLRRKLVLGSGRKPQQSNSIHRLIPRLTESRAGNNYEDPTQPIFIIIEDPARL